MLGYAHKLNKNLNAKIELYYQDLYNIPVENVDTSYYSILNSDEGYVFAELVNKGTGKNYGVEFTLERYFANNYYFLFTTSLYESKYKALDGIERNTKYNGNYALNFLAGKEFYFGNGNHKRILGLNAKVFYNGGKRYIPLDLNASIHEDDNVWRYDEAWKDRMNNVFQVNFSANMKFNRPRVTHELVIDILNITNNQAKIDEYYNSTTKNIDFDKQLSILPNIMYRIYF